MLRVPLCARRSEEYSSRKGVHRSLAGVRRWQLTKNAVRDEQLLVRDGPLETCAGLAGFAGDDILEIAARSG